VLGLDLARVGVEPDADPLPGFADRPQLHATGEVAGGHGGVLGHAIQLVDLEAEKSAPFSSMKLRSAAININLGGNFLCTRAFISSMRAQRSGRIISIASGIAHYGAKQFAHYAASKAAVIGLVKSLAREVALDGITVNAICPGSANTAMPRQHRSEEEVMARLRSTPLAHVLEPEDIVGPVLFLCSDEASYITGQAYNVNCGTYMM
jgi:NAD(P)-dependent dehydrogenase (short-subunit alcohol dehydrogenase family)